MDETTILVIIQIVVTLVVGVILWNQIKSQKSLLDGYKNLVDAISPEKMKEQMSFIELAAERKHKFLASQQIEGITKEITGQMISEDQKFADAYNEMMNVHVYQMSKLDKVERETVITNWFPVCGERIRDHLKNFDKRKSDGDSSNS